MKELISVFEGAICVHEEPRGTWVVRWQEISLEDFQRNCACLEDRGFTAEARDAADGRCFRAYRRGQDGDIMDTLSRKTEYTSGNGWQIVDITNGNAPRVIGREDNNSWLMSCDIVIKIYRKDETTNV